VLGALLLCVLAFELLLVLLVLFGEDANNAGGDFMVMLSSPTMSAPNSLVGRLVKI
jgi:hypothetical protein